VSIVMGDIADIEKKKSMGISSLILGARGVPIKRKDGAIDQDVGFENLNKVDIANNVLNLFTLQRKTFRSYYPDWKNVT